MIHAEFLTKMMCVSITILNHGLYLRLTSTNILVLILLTCFTYKLKKSHFHNDFLKIIFREQIQEPCNGFLALMGNPGAQKSADLLKKLKYGLLQQSTLNVLCKGYAFQLVICICLQIFFPPLVVCCVCLLASEENPSGIVASVLLTPGEQTAIMGN